MIKGDARSEKRWYTLIVLLAGRNGREKRARADINIMKTMNYPQLCECMCHVRTTPRGRAVAACPVIGSLTCARAHVCTRGRTRELYGIIWSCTLCRILFKCPHRRDAEHQSMSFPATHNSIVCTINIRLRVCT